MAFSATFPSWLRYADMASCAFSFAGPAVREICHCTSSVSQRSSFASRSRSAADSATGKPRMGGWVSSAGKILYGCGSSAPSLAKSITIVAVSRVGFSAAEKAKAKAPPMSERWAARAPPPR